MLLKEICVEYQLSKRYLYKHIEIWFVANLTAFMELKKNKKLLRTILKRSASIFKFNIFRLHKDDSAQQHYHGLRARKHIQSFVLMSRKNVKGVNEPSSPTLNGCQIFFQIISNCIHCTICYRHSHLSLASFTDKNNL